MICACILVHIATMLQFALISKPKPALWKEFAVLLPCRAPGAQLAAIYSAAGAGGARDGRQRNKFIALSAFGGRQRGRCL